jgi:hypothetical protein
VNKYLLRFLSIGGIGVAFTSVLASATATAAPRDLLYLYRLNAVNSTAPVDVKRFPDQIKYHTASGSIRTVKIAVRKPPNAALPSPLPVVIVAHGGGEQPNDRDVATTLPEWGETLARAGYLAINVLHGTNVGIDRLNLCQAIGYPVSSDAVAIGAALQNLVASMVTANPVAGNVKVKVADLVKQFPGVFDELEDIVDEQADESPIVGQVVQELLTELQGCGSINTLGLWDRPHDIAAVVDALHDQVIPELVDWVDVNKIAVLGHSNGSSSVLNAVGMQRALPNGVKVPVPFPAGNPRRPIAAVALSPMGVNDYGLFDTAAWKPNMDFDDSKRHSWGGLRHIPVMTITGDGDNHCKTRYVCSNSDSPGKRMIPFARMPADDKPKYLMYIADRKANEIVSSHEMFGSLDQNGVCKAPSLAQRCAETVRWIKSTVIAFLDWHVRGIPRAKTWLNSSDLSRASRDIADIVRK